MKILSDQMTEGELKVIQRELRATLQRGVAGDVTEFGCYVGTTSVILAEELAGQQPVRTLYLYDSFSGLPEKTREDISPAGEQFVAGELHASRQELERNIRPWRAAQAVHEWARRYALQVRSEQSLAIFYKPE